MEIKNKIRFFALENASKFKGKANPGAIIGKILSEDSSWKEKAKELNQIIMPIVKEVNSFSVERQEEEFQSMIDSGEFEVKKKEEKEHDLFSFVDVSEGEEVVTSFPPGAEKYPHIGHAKALLVNYLLAKKFNGKFKLRFEDTNPNLVKQEYYDAMIEDFKWLGVTWDTLDYASDHMELYYKHAEELIRSGDAYVCFCDGERIRESRMKGKACECRSRSPEENLKSWAEFKEMEEGIAILRLKIDLEHKNSTMRDPTIFRIIEGEHARHKGKYRVWPNYDFQTSIIDGLLGITHRIRSKEFEMRNELQRYIQERLGYSITKIYEFARFNLEGVEASGRKIREGIENGTLVGWDDPSLTTLRALRRRGFLPEAIMSFVISTGITKSESTLTWDDLIIHNKRLLDKTACRYFFVPEPVKVKIAGAPSQTIEIKKHPEDDCLGVRKFETNEEFYLTKEDYDSLELGGFYRLMDCLNFIKEKSDLKFHSTSHLEFKGKGKRIMHFLPVPDSDDSNRLVDVEVMMPDKSVVIGLGETGLGQLAVGDVIQFERFGFVRLDAIEDGKLKFWFTHK